MAVSAEDEEALLAAAKRGDGDAYRRLFGGHRAGLHAHCYRMLGSNADAEDALQEAMLRAWSGLAGFEGRSSLRSWLYAIATNVCLSAAARRPRRALPIDLSPASLVDEVPGPPLLESTFVGPFPFGDAAAGQPEARLEERESVELAFVAALQLLPPRPRAALILHDVLGYPASEVALILGSTPTAVYSALQRAHRAVGNRLPSKSQADEQLVLGDAGIGDLARRYADAWERRDVAELVALLTDDVVVTMPPRPSWYSGLESVAAFLNRFPFAAGQQWRVLPTCANGQLAFAHYLRDARSGNYMAHSLDVITLRSGRIAAMDAFFCAPEFGAFGLPPRLSHG